MFAQSPEEVRRKQAEEFRRRRSRNYTINHEGLDWAFVDGEKEGDTRINCYRCDCNDRIMGKHCKKIVTKKHSGLGWEDISYDEWKELQGNHMNTDRLAYILSMPTVYECLNLDRDLLQSKLDEWNKAREKLGYEKI